MTHTDHETTLATFIDSMDRAEFSRALELFSEDAEYQRPTLNRPGAPLSTGHATYHGKPEIAAFMAARGHRDMLQRIVACAVSDDHLFAEGLIEFDDGSPSIVPPLHLIFNDSGPIQHLKSVR